MSEYVYLMGSEQVQNAGHAIARAGEEIQKAASSINDTVTFHLERRMEEWVSRIEQAAERIAVAMEAAIAQAKESREQ